MTSYQFAQRQALLNSLAPSVAVTLLSAATSAATCDISGSCGHIYAVPGSGFMSHVSCETASGWTYAKKALSFAKLTSDGDDEGGAPAGAGLCGRRTPPIAAWSHTERKIDGILPASGTPEVQ